MLTAVVVTASLFAGLLPGGSAAPGSHQPSVATEIPPAPPDCDYDSSTGECRISVTDKKVWPSPKKGQGKQGTQTVTESSCQFKGMPLPCSTAEGFWDPASSCYLTPQAKPITFGSLQNIPPDTRFYRCWRVFDVVDGKPKGLAVFESIQRRSGQLPPPTIDPREAARQVVEMMSFVAPNLGLSPSVQSASGEAIVNVPVWMWVTDPGVTTTGPQTKRAAVGGVAIDATGTVDRIEWSMGGDVVTCKGAGTPFTPAAAEGKSLKQIPASPTCGHKFRKTSRCEKDQSFQVTATAYWTVQWTGGGTQGDIPLEFSRSVPLKVIDLRPVLVAPDGGEVPADPPPVRACG